VECRLDLRIPAKPRRNIRGILERGESLAVVLKPAVAAAAAPHAATSYLSLPHFQRGARGSRRREVTRKVRQNHRIDLLQRRVIVQPRSDPDDIRVHIIVIISVTCTRYCGFGLWAVKHGGYPPRPNLQLRGAAPAPPVHGRYFPSAGELGRPGAGARGRESALPR
jgi:hypothetical protein